MGELTDNYLQPYAQHVPNDDGFQYTKGQCTNGLVVFNVIARPRSSLLEDERGVVDRFLISPYRVYSFKYLIFFVCQLKYEGY